MMLGIMVSLDCFLIIARSAYTGDMFKESLSSPNTLKFDIFKLLTSINFCCFDNFVLNHSITKRTNKSYSKLSTNNDFYFRAGPYHKGNTLLERKTLFLK